MKYENIEKAKALKSQAESINSKIKDIRTSKYFRLYDEERCSVARHQPPSDVSLEFGSIYYDAFNKMKKDIIAKLEEKLEIILKQINELD